MLIDSITSSAAAHHHPNLAARAAYYISRNIEPSTAASYATAWQSYESFCKQLNVSAFNVNKEMEPVLCMWIASLLDKGVKYRTVTQYIAGLKHHWGSMYVDYTMIDNMTALQRQLQAAKKTNNSAVRTRLSLGHNELMSMKPLIKNDRDGAMIWAAMTIAVAGLLRSGEFTSVRGSNTLTVYAIHMDKQRSSMMVSLPRDKTSPSPVEIHIAATHTANCPVNAMAQYLKYRRHAPSNAPLFEWSNGQPLSQRSRTIIRLRQYHVLPLNKCYCVIVD